MEEISQQYYLIAIGTILVKTGIWIGKVNSDRKNFKEVMEEIRNEIKEIFKQIGANVTTTGSPVRLTKLGKQISECIDAEGITEPLAKKNRRKS